MIRRGRVGGRVFLLFLVKDEAVEEVEEEGWLVWLVDLDFPGYSTKRAAIALR